MRVAKLLLPAALMLGGVLIWSTASFGKQEYAKKEGKTCTFCHVKVGTADAMHKDPNLTEAGKYYSAHNHSLDGYVPTKK
jgi:hypothetical protein